MTKARNESGCGMWGVGIIFAPYSLQPVYGLNIFHNLAFILYPFQGMLLVWFLLLVE